MMAATKPPLGLMILLHAAPADRDGACMYCGKDQPWGPMEPCDGPLPLRSRIARLEAILRAMYDEEPCSYDRHGYCQEHLWLTSPREDVTDTTDRHVCPHRRAQEYFAARDRRTPDEHHARSDSDAPTNHSRPPSPLPHSEGK